MATSATSVRVEPESFKAAMGRDVGIYVGFRGKPEYTPPVGAARPID